MKQNIFLFLKMEKSVIKHFYLNGLTTKEIRRELDKDNSLSAPLLLNIYNWINEFK